MFYKNLAFLIATTSILNFGRAAELYQSEISLINSAHQALLDHGDRVLKASESLNLEWKKITFELSLLATAVSPLRNLSYPAGIVDAETAMSWTIRESVLLASAESAFTRMQADIVKPLESAEKLLKDNSFLMPRHREWRIMLERRIQEFRLALEKRATLNKKQFSELHEYKIKEWLRLETQEREKFVAGIHVDNQIRRLPKIFLKLHNRTRMAIIGERPAEALDYIETSAWLRGMLPPFFSDKVLTHSSMQSLSETIQDALVREKSLLKELNSLQKQHGSITPNRNLSKQSIRMIASIYLISDEKSAWAKNREENKLVIKDDGSKGRYRPGGVIDYTNDADFADVITPEAKVVSKDSDGEKNGLVRYERGERQERLNIESEREIQHATEQSMQESIEREVLKSGSDSASKVAALITRASSSISKNKRNAFEKLVNSVQRWVKTQNIFNDTASAIKERFAQTLKDLELNTKSVNLPDLGVTFGARSIVQTLPAVKMNSAAFSWATLRKAVAASNRASFGDLAQFLPNAPRLAPFDSSYSATIVQDVIDELDEVPPTKRALGGSTPDRFRAISAKLELIRQTHQKLRLDEVVSLTEQISWAIARTVGYKPDYISDEARDRLLEMSKLILSGTGFMVPEITIPIVIYEVTTGKNFMTGEALVENSRVMGALELISFKGPLSSLSKEITAAQWVSDQANQAIEKAEAMKSLQGIDTVKRYGPADAGPLKSLAPGAIAHFKSGTYWEVIANKPTRLFRVEYEDTQIGTPLSHYWTNQPPLATPRSGSSARTVEIKVPAFVPMYIGQPSALGNVWGFGVQVFILNPNPDWLLR